jgi:hypothetical protein
MRRIVNGVSRICFLTGGGFLLVGMHRYIFGIHPKLIWIRDLPWDQVSYEWCFAATLGLALFGAWLGRSVLRADKAAAAKAASVRAGVSPALEPPSAEFRSPIPRPESVIVPPSA